MGQFSERLEQVSLDQGLSQAEVITILQDHEGFLWFGTQQGLNLYDAYRVRVISGPDQLLEIQPSNLLFQDSSQRIWVGSTPNKNFVIDKSANQIREIKLPFPETYEVIESSLSVIHEDGTGTLWMATPWEIFSLPKGATTPEFVISLLPTISNQHIIRAMYRYQSLLIIGTSSGLYVFNVESQQLTKLAWEASLTPTTHGTSQIERDDRHNIKGLYRSHQGHILIATVAGLFQITIKQLEQAVSQPEQTMDITELVEDLNIWRLIEKSDYYWLATHDGLYQLFKDGQLKHHFRYSDTPYQSADNNIITMIEDREGNLWLGSRNDGAFRWRPDEGYFRYYQQNDQQAPLSHNRVWAVKEDQQGNLWVGTRNGLNRIDGKTGRSESFLINTDPKAIESEATITDIEFQDKRIWMNTFSGVRVFDKNTRQESFPVLNSQIKEVFDNGINDLFFVDDNQLLVVNYQGLHHYNTQNDTYTFDEASASNGKVPRMFFKVLGRDPNDKDRLLMAMADQVVSYSLSESTYNVIHQLPEADEPRTWPSSVLYGKDYIWIAYPGFGLYLLDKKSGEELKHFTSLNGLPDNSPLDIHQDSDGYVWVTSNSGLLRIDPLSLHIRHFDTSDHLATNEFNGNATTVTRDGRFAFGSIKGVLLFDPKEVNRPKRHIDINNHITRVSLMSRPLAPSYGVLKDYSLDLYHDDYGLRVEYSALRFTNANKVQYKYWIEGSSKLNEKTVNQSELFLPRLSSGVNRVYISAIDYETGQESSPIFFDVKVHPPFYLSWWAYTIYIVVFSSLLFIIYIQKHNKQLFLLASNKFLKESEERLQLALSGSDSGLWDWQSQTNEIYEPRIKGLIDSPRSLIDFNQKIEFVHPEDREKFIRKWHSFMDGEVKVFDVVYRMKSISGDWRWYRDMARATELNEESYPIRVTGTYTDITERKDTRDKMFLFYEAFENTRDIIVILNNDYKVIAVNRAFYSITGLKENEVLRKSIQFLTHDGNEQPFTKRLQQAMQEEKQCESEGFITRRFQDRLPVLINATQFESDEHETYFVITITDISDQKAAQENLRRMANYDNLTGLPNRALLLDRITHAIEHSHRRNLKIAVCFIDLDRFKHINDSLGHEVGDQVLVHTAKLLKASVREDDTVARLGGDEFVVVLEDFKSISVIQKVAKTVIERMSQPLKIDHQEVTVSPSIGIATYPEDGSQPEQLLKHADIAMYHAKNRGRNNYQFFKTAMNTEAQQRLSLENQVRNALKHGEFYLEYQPQIELTSGRIKGFEALARWKAEDGTIIPPADFIPISEELGLIIPMTEAFIEQAMHLADQWRQQKLYGGIAINLSAQHLQKRSLIDFVAQKMEQYQFKPGTIEFEITESLLMADVDVSLELMSAINKLGIHFSLDDFGTGYSSLKYLYELPINKIKIDRSFVWQLGVKPQSEAIIKTILSLSRSLNLTTVVEGVENKSQLKKVEDLGADYVQGFYYSKPVSKQRATEMLQQQSVHAMPPDNKEHQNS